MHPKWRVVTSQNILYMHIRLINNNNRYNNEGQKLTNFFNWAYCLSVVFYNIQVKSDLIKKGIQPEKYSAVSNEGEDLTARAEYEFNMLKDPKTGTIPAGIRSRELKYARTLPKLDGKNSLLKGNKTQALTWVSRGPVNQGGRTRALAIDVYKCTISIL